MGEVGAERTDSGLMTRRDEWRDQRCQTCGDVSEEKRLEHETEGEKLSRKPCQSDTRQGETSSSGEDPE